MAKKNPTGGERSVPLDLRPSQIAILRSNLASCLHGVRSDLEAPELMQNPDRARREAAAYERLLSGLARGQVVVPDKAARDALEAIVADTDKETNYAEIVAEHDALQALLDKIRGRLA